MADTGMVVPAVAGDLTSALFSSALGRPLEVTAVERVGEAFGFTGATFRVTFDGGAERVIAKLWSMTKADDMREISFYQRCAAETPAPLPRFLHGRADVHRRRAWLVLEELTNFRQGDDLAAESLPTVLAIVGLMARIQATWSGRLDGVSWLPCAPGFRRDPAYLADRRREYLLRFGPLPDPAARRLFDDIPHLVPVANELLRGAPATLLHLDLSLDNLLFLQPGDRPALIDWARCGRGPGVHDLASVLFGMAPVDRMGEAVAHHIDSLNSAGLVVEPDDVVRWLGGAMIHEFITRTLGVARWAADTPRGLTILDRQVRRTPSLVAAWQALDPKLFARLSR